MSKGDIIDLLVVYIGNKRNDLDEIINDFFVFLHENNWYYTDEKNLENAIKDFMGEKGIEEINYESNSYIKTIDINNVVNNYARRMLSWI